MTYDSLEEYMDVHSLYEEYGSKHYDSICEWVGCDGCEDCTVNYDELYEAILLTAAEEIDEIPRLGTMLEVVSDWILESPPNAIRKYYKKSVQ